MDIAARLFFVITDRMLVVYNSANRTDRKCWDYGNSGYTGYI